jgi:hypothetical protein
MLKAEFQDHGLTYQKPAELLAVQGLRDTSENLTNKINRAEFLAGFMLQCFGT